MRVKETKVLMGRLPHGADLHGALQDLCVSEDVRIGTFFVIGAVKNVKLGYYHQDKKQYVECVDLKKTLEITACLGNVSLLDSEIFVHAHITLADHQGQCYGGHLMPGTRVFAAEYCVRAYDGSPLERAFDHETGLKLWNK
jgi:hypothetical protein